MPTFLGPSGIFHELAAPDQIIDMVLGAVEHFRRRLARNDEAFRLLV